MGIEPPSEVERGIESPSAILRVALPPKFKPSFDELDIGTLAQRVVHDHLILIHCDGACRVDEISTCLRLGTDAVNGTQNQLLLQMRQEREVAVGLLSCEC